MLRKFAEGLVFGAGFVISGLVIAMIGVPLLISSAPISERAPFPVQYSSSSAQVQEVQFHELPIEEQIKKASVIALARYEPDADGKMKAVVKELLKKDPGTVFHYEIGDEYAPSSYYPKEATQYGDGLVIFFVGSPATMRMAMSYSGDRIHSLGDMPLQLLRHKCGKDEKA